MVTYFLIGIGFQLVSASAHARVTRRSLDDVIANVFDDHGVLAVTICFFGVALTWPLVLAWAILSREEP